MRRHKLALFDLDGTLTASAPGVIAAVKYALTRFGIEETDESRLRSFVGPPLLEAFREVYGLSHEDAAQMLKYFREYYNDRGVYENAPFEGVEQMLAALREAGIFVALATSKPEYLAHVVLRHFGLIEYFDFIAAATPDEARTTKDEVMAYAVERIPIEDPADAVMVGDRKFDILSANRFGLDSIGVLFGYGGREELEQAGATLLVETVEQLQVALLGE